MFHSSSNALRHHPRQQRHLIRSGQVGARIPNTDIAKLLQYSGSRVEHRDGFSS